MSIGRVIGKTIVTRGIEAAIDEYHTLKEKKASDYNFNSDDELNRLGYALLRHGDRKEAIAIFRLNVETFPESWNVYDSLGEAYLANGSKELAIQYYRRSVELNPENRGAIEVLKSLETK